MSSQVSDGQICVPMRIGLFAVFDLIQFSAFFQMGAFIIPEAGLVHFQSIALLGRDPRTASFGLIGV